MMTSQANVRIAQFEKALQSLRTASSAAETDVVRDAMIHRFENTFELALCALRDPLIDNGCATTTDGLVECAYEQNLISDLQLWEQIYNHRASIKHAYDDVVASAITKFIRMRAVEAFEMLLVNMKLKKSVSK